MEVVSKHWICEVDLWNHTIAAVSWDANRNIALFEYAPEFLRSNIQIAPLTMPLQNGVYSFSDLSKETFHGLPGLIADSLPDRFGNALIDQWLIRHGRSPGSFSPLERLCYLGKRGMGALEFKPSLRPGGSGASIPLEIAELTEIAQLIVSRREGMGIQTKVRSKAKRQAMEQLLRVGTSAGGARAKAVIAWNPTSGEIRSGQGKAPQGFEHWLLKFDGVTNRDKDTTDPTGFGRIEYAYSQMASLAGIQMEPCRLLEENGRAHFMTRRFDRSASGEKIHVQSLCAIAHLDFNMAGAHSYEQGLHTMVRLGLPMPQLVEFFRRMVFNIVCRNQDDHTRNIAFLMDKSGTWRLAPAFDMTYSYNPDGFWTSTHQMSLNGKRDGFLREDFQQIARKFHIPKHLEILEQVQDSAKQWTSLTKKSGIPLKTARNISKTFRTF